MNILKRILGLNKKQPELLHTDSLEAEAKPIADPTAPTSELLRPFLAFMEGMADNLSIERIDTLTLREAIVRFVEGKNERCEPVKGALIVQPHREGNLVLWAFLDNENGVIRGDGGAPLGRKAICAALDEELTTMLGGRELLIVN